MSDLTTPVESSAEAERAVELVGPGGLLTGLTKTVLETALEAELGAASGVGRVRP